LFLRALFAFLALPGVVAFAIPAALIRYGGHSGLAQPPGLVAAALGILLLLWCAGNFYVSGKGTLAPWAPPRNLVTGGPYRYSRNPMYVAVVLILFGWAIAFASRPMLAYALAVAAGFHVRVVRGEEPWLARTHGAAWDDYVRRVPRWFW
jgi:protein-S-isoprenylcysteine O-methyltransferase Ste14